MRLETSGVNFGPRKCKTLLRDIGRELKQMEADKTPRIRLATAPIQTNLRNGELDAVLSRVLGGTTEARTRERARLKRSEPRPWQKGDPLPELNISEREIRLSKLQDLLRKRLVELEGEKVFVPVTKNHTAGFPTNKDELIEFLIRSTKNSSEHSAGSDIQLASKVIKYVEDTFTGKDLEALNRLAQKLMCKALAFAPRAKRIPRTSTTTPKPSLQPVAIDNRHPLEIFESKIRTRFLALQKELAHNKGITIQAQTLIQANRELEASIESLQTSLAACKSWKAATKIRNRVEMLQSQLEHKRKALEQIELLAQSMQEFEALVESLQSISPQQNARINSIIKILRPLDTLVESGADLHRALTLCSLKTPVNPLYLPLYLALAAASPEVKEPTASKDSQQMSAKDLEIALRLMKEKASEYTPDDWRARLNQLAKQSGLLARVEKFRADIAMPHNLWAAIQKTLSPLKFITSVSHNKDFSGLNRIKSWLFQSGSKLKEDLSKLFETVANYKIRLTSYAESLFIESRTKFAAAINGSQWINNPLIKEANTLFAELEAGIQRLGISPKAEGLKVKV